MNLCAPAIVYLVLAGLSLLFMMFYKFQLLSIIVKIIIILIWTWFLNFLCDKGYPAISWFLVALPFIIIIICIIIAYEMSLKLKNHSGHHMMH